MRGQMTNNEYIARWFYEMGYLKRAPRTGWFLAGVENPESVAEHSFRAALIAYSLAVQEGADPYRTATLALFHDTGETRTGDIPSVGRAYLKAADELEVVADQVADLPPALAQSIRNLIDEYEARAAQEALLAKDADMLECLCQAREYMAKGYSEAEQWAVSSAEAVRSPSARRLAEAILAVEPGEWWRTFVETHNSRREVQRLKTLASGESGA